MTVVSTKPAQPTLDGSVSKSRFRQSAIILVVANYVLAFVSMGVNMLLTDKLGQTGYGTFRYGIVIGTFVACFVNLGSQRTIVRDLVHSKSPAAMMSSSVALRLVSALIVLVVGIALTLTSEMTKTKLLVAWMCGLAAVCTAMSPKGWFDVQYKMHWHATLLLLEKFLFAASCLVWIFGLATNKFLFGVACCWLLARVVSCVTQWAFCLRSFSWDDGWNPSRIFWLFKENVWVFGAVLGGTLAAQGSQLVLDAVQGNRAMAFYGLAFSMVAMGQLFVTQLDRLLAPRIAAITDQRKANNLDEIRRQLVRYAVYALCGSICIASAIFVVGPVAIRWLLPAPYEASVPILRYLCVWCCLLGPNLVMARFLICLRCHKVQFSLSIFRGLLAVALSPLLVMLFEGVGVAFAVILAAICFGSAGYFYLLFLYRPGEVKPDAI